jgi:hypothetical protein
MDMINVLLGKGNKTWRNSVVFKLNDIPMNNFIRFFLLGNILTACVSQNMQPCINANNIFDSLGADDSLYKRELAKELVKADLSKVLFYFEGYVEKNGKEYLNVSIHGDNLCANAMMRVTQWKGIEDIKRTKGLSYCGAELKGLKFDAHRDSLETEFIYTSVEKIID